MLIGVAYQMGLLPMSAQSIETAIQLNGTSVKMNLQAFRWGRLRIADPVRVQQLLDAGAPQRAELPDSIIKWVTECVPGLDVGSELHRLLVIRAAELIEFQNRDYARRYLAFVARTRERRPQDEALALAVARNLYKLMAYKDEYEVARLHLDTIAQAELNQAFSEKVQIAWNFHPTFLRSLGVRKKVQLGGWFRPFLYLLRGMKFIRGTPFDLLGYTQVRRIERALPGFYEAMLDAALARDESTTANLLTLAETPDMVRGYEHVKLGNVSKFMAEVMALQRKLGIQVQAPEILAAQQPAPLPNVQASAA
jgi:indolepyruvate ferredoxin oxidoreductase